MTSSSPRREARPGQSRFSELFIRHEQNPILEAGRWPYPAHSVFNPGAVRLPSGERLLLVRVEDRRGASHFATARSADGVSDWVIDPEPALMPRPEDHPEELWGIEDPRIVWLDEIQRYAVTYTAFSRNGPLVALALTEDFREFERRGPITPPEDKDAALFPYRIGGRWVLIHRPVASHGSSKANMWLSFSPDLKHWGDHMMLMEARDGSYWDAGKIGLSPPPVATSEGWLILYHGVRHTASGALYRMGLALLDLEDPRVVVARGEDWVFGPSASYEVSGDVPNVVFSCGTVVDESGQMQMYYGAADTSIGVATANVSDLLQWLRSQRTPRSPS
ncbi:MAG: glycosidase [Chloroflexi bacterium HGW-Chloroflexi-9]|nr:MAG: glycosidase [Chloroflexi bacterium HGW-Chloroflexi-9]